MKLFVVVIMFAMSSFALAADVVWQVAPPFSLTLGGSAQESGQAPKNYVANSDKKQDQAQSSQQNAGNVPILNAEPNTKISQTANQQSQGNVYPNEDPHGGWNWGDSLRWIVPSIIALIALFFTILSHKRNKRVDKFAHLKERPLLSLVDWMMTPHDRGKVRVLGEEADTIKYVLENTNGVPAILGGIYEERWIVEELPPAPDFRSRLNDRLRGRPLKKDGRLDLSLKQIPTEEWKAVKNGKKTLYAFVFVEYSDLFGSKYEACALMKYQDKIFMVEGHPDYTCNT